MILGIVERRTTMPILSHVLLNAVDGNLILQGTDLANTVTVSCDIRAQKDLCVAVPVDKVFELMKEFGDDEDILVKATDRNWIEISGGEGKFRIAGLPGEDFPDCPETDQENMVAVSSEKLEKMVVRTAFCIPEDDMKKNLFGLFFEKRGDHKLRLVATDGHRLSFAEDTVDGLVLPDNNVLVTKKAVLEIRKLLRLSKEVRMGISRKHFIFELPSENLRLVSRVKEEEFPDYMQVVPASTKNVAKMSSSQFRSALRRVLVLSSEYESAGKFVELQFRCGELQLDTRQQTGEGKESVQTDYDGEEVCLGFNGGYIEEVMDVIGSPEIQIGFSSNKNPVCVFALDEGEKREGYMNVIMPLDIEKKSADGGNRSEA